MINPRSIHAPRAPDGFELAGLLSALRDQQHPAITRFDEDQAALEFLLDDCMIAVFDRFIDGEDGDADPISLMLIVMDAGPEYVSSARLEAGAQIWQLAHTTLGDFIPYEQPSRHAKSWRAPSPPKSTAPRAADADDLQDFLRMFRSVDEPFLMSELKNDAERLAYLGDAARIAIFDHCKSGAHEGSLAFLLWPVGPRFVTVAIRSGGRWRFAGGEFNAA